MTRADRLAHLAGYAGVVAVLASATWAGPIGMLLGAIFVFGTVGYAGYVGYDVLTDQVRAEAADAAEPTAATDGGRPVSTIEPENVADAIETHGAANVRDDQIVAALRGER